MEENKSGIEISIQDLLSIFIKRIWFIIICMVLVGLIAFVYSRFYVTPLYRSEVMFLIDPIYSTNTIDPSYSDAAKLQLEYQSLAYAKQLTNTYLQIFQTNTFRTKLADEYYELYEKPLNGSLSIMEITDTELFKIRVTSSSVEDAYNIATLIEKVAPETIAEVMGAEKIRVTDNAVMSRAPINNNTNRNTLVGILLGAIFAYGIGFLIFLFDNRVKDEDDLKSHYDVPILGGIVDFEISYKEKK